jgi:putative MATE family efflux protein
MAAEQSKPFLQPGLISLAWPVAVENMLNMSLMWADSIIINHRLGTESFAAVQMSGQLMNVIGLIMAIIAAGASIVISHQVGAGERTEACETADQSIGAGLLLSIGLGAVLWLGAPLLLRALGAVGTVHSQGVVFMRVLSLFMPAMGMISIFGGVLRAAGDTRGPMFVTLLVNVLNVILNFFFVWGLPAFHLGSLQVPALGGHMGLAGSATGTSIARIIGALLMLGMLLRQDQVRVRIAHFFRFRSAPLWRVARMGLPGAAEWISWQASQVVLTAIVASLGTVVIAARGIAGQTEAFTYLPAQGLATAASILVGQQMGARRREDAVATARRSMIYGAGAMGALGLLLFVFARPVAQIFTSDTAVLDVAVAVLRISTLYKVGQALNIICGGIYRGAGNPQWPTVLTTIGTWSITVPAALYAVKMGYGLTGVVWASFTDEMVRGAINLWYFTTPRWRFRHV